MTTDKKMLRSIARIVRKNIKPIIKKNPKVFDSDYCGACAVSSYVLSRVYRKFNIPAVLITGEYRGSCHAFVLVQDQIIDITATQFNFRLPKVLITDKQDKRYEMKYKGRKAIADLKEWWTCQQPFTYRKSLNTIIEKSIRDINDTIRSVQEDI